MCIRMFFEEIMNVYSFIMISGLDGYKVAENMTPNYCDLESIL